MKIGVRTAMVALAIVTALCAETIPSVDRHVLAGELATALMGEKAIPCPQLDWATIRSLPNTGNADDPARPDFQLSPREEKDLVQSRARIEQWWAQHSSERTVDNPIESGALESVTPYQYSIAMPAREQETGDWCGVASTQMMADYEWGYTGSQSAFTQTFIATEEGANPSVTSSSIVNFLNNHLAPNVTWTWVREQLPYAQGEVQAATTLFNITDPNIQLGHGTAMSLITDDGGLDAWGEPYGLIGWNVSSQHFVAGDGVLLQSDNRHRIMYIDPWETTWTGGPNSLGQHTIDAANMAHLMGLNTGFLVH